MPVHYGVHEEVVFGYLFPPDLEIQTENFPATERYLVDNEMAELRGAKRRDEGEDETSGSFRVVLSSLLQLALIRFRAVLSLLPNVSLFSNGKTHGLLCITYHTAHTRTQAVPYVLTRWLDLMVRRS